MSSIFREDALDEIQSPEELDSLLEVTDFKGWVALLALGLVIVVSVAWGVYGEIPTKVQGQGMLIKSGGVKDIAAPGSGEITDIQVQVGDEVDQGQIIARIAQPELKQKLGNKRERLAELREEKKEVQDFNTRKLRLRDQQITQKRRNLEKKIETLKERQNWLEEKIESRKELLEQGLITEQQLINTRQEYQRVIQQIDQTENDLQSTKIQRVELRNQQQQRIRSLNNQISGVRRTIDSLLERFNENTRVRSSNSGRVLGITVSEGDLVQAGSTLMTLELIGKSIMDVETVFYVPASDGKKIEPGMDVKVSPSTVRAEKYGYLLGKVVDVSKFPVSSQQMMNVLGNQSLVEQFTKQGSPIQVYAYLVPDADSASGYRWSSNDPPVQITPGTIATGSVVVEQEAPINLVIPMVQQYLGL